MPIRLARVYDETDGHRVLVDRLWPRGIAKATAPWHDWRKDLAPSDELRQAYHDGGVDFERFQGLPSGAGRARRATRAGAGRPGPRHRGQAP